MIKSRQKAAIALTLALLICLSVCAVILCGCDNTPTWYYGEGEPNPSTGKDGDIYLDKTDMAFYEKVDGQWIKADDNGGDDYPHKSILLPDVLYASVGQTMEIYFRNVIAYELDDVLIKCGTDIPESKLYSDKWTGTPKKAGIFALEISLYSKNWERITTKRVSIVVKDTTAPLELKALVIGDSTVYAGHETSRMLQLAAADDNVNLQLLGTLDFWGDGNRHEGRSGWKATSYTSFAEIDGWVNPFFNSQTKTFDFAYYMNEQGYDGVDAVFFQLGINDIFNSMEDTLDADIKALIDSLDEMIASIHAYNPQIKVVINPIIPCCQDQDIFGYVYGIRTVWEYMRKMYIANNALIDAFSGKNNVYVSYYNACLDLENNQPRDVHPTPEGYYQLGYQMYYYIKAVMS